MTTAAARITETTGARFSPTTPASHSRI
jgi:hypothetical protein